MTSTGRSGARLAPQWLLSGFGSPILSAPDGAFEFRVSGWIRGGFVVVQKEGFETSYMNVTWVDARPGDTVATTLRLHAIVRIRAGETVELDILDPRVQCDADSESYPACRSIRVTSERTGRLIVRTEKPFVVFSGGWDGDGISLDVKAGSETTINVILLDPPPRRATVRTELAAP
jgi:hypothetical protein